MQAPGIILYEEKADPNKKIDSTSAILELNKANTEVYKLGL